MTKFPDQSSVIYGMSMYRESELLVTCGRDKYVKLWDTREKSCVATMRGHMNTVSCVASLENTRQVRRYVSLLIKGRYYLLKTRNFFATARCLLKTMLA